MDSYCPKEGKSQVIKDTSSGHEDKECGAWGGLIVEMRRKQMKMSLLQSCCCNLVFP